VPKAKLTDIQKRRTKQQDEFVKGKTPEQQPNIQTSEHADIQTSTRRRTTVYLAPDLHRQLKRAAVDHEREMSELVESAVREYLKTLTLAAS